MHTVSEILLSFFFFLPFNLKELELQWWVYIFSVYLQACFHSVEYDIEHAKKKWYHNLGTKQK